MWTHILCNKKETLLFMRTIQARSLLPRKFLLERKLFYLESQVTYMCEINSVYSKVVSLQALSLLDAARLIYQDTSLTTKSSRTRELMRLFVCQ